MKYEVKFRHGSEHDTTHLNSGGTDGVLAVAK